MSSGIATVSTGRFKMARPPDFSVYIRICQVFTTLYILGAPATYVHGIHPHNEGSSLGQRSAIDLNASGDRLRFSAGNGSMGDYGTYIAASDGNTLRDKGGGSPGHRSDPDSCLRILSNGGHVSSKKDYTRGDHLLGMTLRNPSTVFVPSVGGSPEGLKCLMRLASKYAVAEATPIINSISAGGTRSAPRASAQSVMHDISFSHASNLGVGCVDGDAPQLEYMPFIDGPESDVITYSLTRCEAAASSGEQLTTTSRWRTSTTLHGSSNFIERTCSLNSGRPVRPDMCVYLPFASAINAAGENDGHAKSMGHVDDYQNYNMLNCISATDMSVGMTTLKCSVEFYRKMDGYDNNPQVIIVETELEWKESSRKDSRSYTKLTCNYGKLVDPKFVEIGSTMCKSHFEELNLLSMFVHHSIYNPDIVHQMIKGLAASAGSGGDSHRLYGLSCGRQQHKSAGEDPVPSSDSARNKVVRSRGLSSFFGYISDEIFSGRAWRRGWGPVYNCMVSGSCDIAPTRLAEPKPERLSDTFFESVYDYLDS